MTPMKYWSISRTPRRRHSLSEPLSFPPISGGVLQTASVHRVAGRVGRSRWESGAATKIWSGHQLSRQSGNPNYPATGPECSSVSRQEAGLNLSKKKTKLNISTLLGITLLHCTTHDHGWACLKWGADILDVFLKGSGNSPDCSLDTLLWHICVQMNSSLTRRSEYTVWSVFLLPHVLLD